MREYQTAKSDHLTARLVAAILHKLGETSITISSEDLKSLPPGHIEAHGDPFGGTVTYRFRKYDHTDPDQQELPLAVAAPSFRPQSLKVGDRLHHRFPGQKKADEAVVRFVGSGMARLETLDDGAIRTDWVGAETYRQVGDGYDDWVKACQHFLHQYGATEAGLWHFKRYSARSPKYDEEACEKLWNGFATATEPGEGSPQTCRVTQYSDLMMCHCGVQFDTNEPTPPRCPQTGEPARSSGNFATATEPGEDSPNR